MTRRVAKSFAPGFRLSEIDVAILVGGVVAAVAVGRFDAWVGVAVAFVVGHFFLFCNVVRLSRRSELIWAGAFQLLAVLTAVQPVISWPIVFTTSAALSAVLVAVECRRPWYHGVGWQWLNPRLPDWWAARRSDDAAPPS